MRRLLSVMVLVFGLIALPSPSANSDVLQCPYPATGFQAVVQPLVGQAVGYICNYPLERNLAHLHAEYGGYTLGGNANGNNIFGLGGSGQINIGVGLTLWSQSWRCPDERYIAAPPNGVGAWKDPQNLQGVKCPAVSRAPLALDAPWPPIDPNIVVVMNKVLPPGEPDPTAGPPDAPPLPGPPAVHDGATPAITDPVRPNPDTLSPNGT